MCRKDFRFSARPMPHTTQPKSSTTKVKTSQFTPHGVVELWMEGSLMHYQATGPFNTELVDCLAIAQRDYLLATQPTGAWASVCTVVGNAMSSPEGVARYAEIMSAPKPANMIPVATAFVIAPGVEGGRIMAPLFTKVFANIGRPFKIFETMADAQIWAQAMIDEADAK
jgi:hypothetical protein